MGTKKRLSDRTAIQEECYYCGRPTVVGDGKKNALNMRTLDHVWPLHMGSFASVSHNIVTACFECNQQKSNLSPVEWAALRRGTGFHGEPWRSWESIIGLGEEREFKTEVSWMIGQAAAGNAYHFVGCKGGRIRL